MCGFIWGHAWFYLGGMHGFIWGGMHGFIRGGHVWFYLGGMHDFIRGHAWFYSGGMHGFIRGGMHGFIWGGMCGFSRGGVCGFFSFLGYNEIRSMSGRYASYWNAFLFINIFTSHYFVNKKRRNYFDGISITGVNGNSVRMEQLARK